MGYNYVNTQKCYVLAIIIFIIIGTDVPNWYIPPETQSPHLLHPCILMMLNFNEHKRVSNMWQKLQLQVYANGFGTGKGTHVSIGVCVMKGENDENLSWSLHSEISQLEGG